MDVGSLEDVIEEQEFLELLDPQAQEFMVLARGLQRTEEPPWSKTELGHLNELAHNLESFLDDFSARSNKRFFFFTELVASIRGFSVIARTLRHIRTRFRRYAVDFEPDELEEFLLGSAATAGFLVRSLERLIGAFLEEARVLGLSVPDRSGAPITSPDEVRHHLPHDIDAGDGLDTDAVVAQIATRFTVAHERFEPLRVTRTVPSDRIIEWVDERLDEAKAREFEAWVHGTQARYDSFIKGTAVEDEPLLKLRGHISIVLHLLEMTTRFIHFYERHERDVRWESARLRMGQLIDAQEVLERSVNFCLRFATLAFERGKAVAQSVIGKFSQIQELVMTLPEGMTLHARPLSLLVRIVSHHGTSVEMRIGSERCNAASIMQMIRLAGLHPDRGEVAFVGDARALEDVKRLFECGLGEGEGGVAGLPDSLAYLKQ